MTPGQLVKAVALALDVPEETIVQHDRNLVVAGLRTKGGRGLSAPSVTALDAARLYVAALASIRVKGSEQVVRSFEETEFLAPKSAADIFAQRAKERGIELDELRQTRSRVKFNDIAVMRLPPEHNFVEAIASLIGDACGPVSDHKQHLERFAPLWITCEMPWARASIRHVGFSGSGANYTVPLKASTSKSGEKRPEEPLWARLARFYGITQRRESGGTALILLGRAFRENGLNFKNTKEAIQDFVEQAFKKPTGKIA